MHRAAVRQMAEEARRAVVIGSDPAAVDDEVLRGAHRAVVGGEEQRHARDVLGQQGLVDALAARDLLRPFSSSQRRICFSVITQPGTSVLTRMLNGPKSRARLRVSPCTAAFEVV